MRLFAFISFLSCMLNIIAGGIYDNSKYDNPYADGNLKPRIVVMTDIAPGDTEPDDNESIVRLLSHADLFEIEAIITCSGWNNSGRLYDENWTKYLHNVINAYKKDVPNLMKRSGQTSFRRLSEENGRQEIGYWPSPEYLRNRHKMGSLGLGLDRLGKDNESDGSNIIIELAEEDDLRPLWLLVWGGGNTIAQALWQLNETGDTARLIKSWRRLGSIPSQTRMLTGTEEGSMI